MNFFFFFISCCAQSFRQCPQILVLAAGIALTSQPTLPLLEPRHPVGTGRETIATSTDQLGNCPYMAWKELREGISMDKAVQPFLSSTLQLVINEIMWDYAKRQHDMSSGAPYGITKRACCKHYREELADALMWRLLICGLFIYKGSPGLFSGSFQSIPSIYSFLLPFSAFSQAVHSVLWAHIRNPSIARSGPVGMVSGTAPAVPASQEIHLAFPLRYRAKHFKYLLSPLPHSALPK